MRLVAAELSLLGFIFASSRRTGICQDLAAPFDVPGKKLFGRLEIAIEENIYFQCTKLMNILLNLKISQRCTPQLINKGKVAVDLTSKILRAHVILAAVTQQFLFGIKWMAGSDKEPLLRPSILTDLPSRGCP